MKTILKNTAILLVITLVAAVALSYVYELTKDPIAEAAQAAKEAAYQEVYAAASAFAPAEGTDLAAFNSARKDGSSIEEILIAKDEAGQTLGYVLTACSSKGYGGAIRLALGIDVSGKVVGYTVLSHSESPGFGANCVNADVKAQFDGITDAAQIDGISGATYTTKALRGATNAALDLVNSMGGEGA